MSTVLKEVREQDETVFVVAQGELTLRESPEFHTSLIALCNKAPRRMIINLEGVPFIDSSGVGTLTDIFRRMKRNQGHLGLVGLNKMVRSVFEITKLDQLFSIYDTEEEAMRS